MNFAEQVKSQVDIVRTVSDYVTLRKVGARYVGLCPFHTEKTGSFNVNPSIGIFICFGCGVKGDIFKFIQEIEQLTFWEALKLLAERNGIALPARERNDTQTELRLGILEMHEAAAKAFQDSLSAANGSEARQYLAKRGLTQSAVEQFSIGFSERAGSDLLRRLRQQYSPEHIEASGLFGRREDGSFYDRFRGRLMFPIHNESGKVIAFGGRSLRADDEPKYLNSPETAIYKKTHVLYNLHRAKDAIRKTSGTVLVEGYMDVIGVYSAGVRQVVASCGTALTEEQVRSIKRHSDHIVVNFDPDTAGSNAAERSIQILLDQGMHVRILELTGGLDPDEFIKKHGADDYTQRLNGAANYFIWLADHARRRFDAGTAEGRMAGFESVLMPAIRKVSDKIERAAIASEVADYLGIDRNVVLQEFRNSRRATAPVRSQTNTSPIPHRERVLLRSLVTDPAIREVALNRIAASEVAQRSVSWPILKVISALHKDGSEVSFTSVENALDDGGKVLLSATFFADTSEEVFSVIQAVAYVELLESEAATLHVDGLRKQLKSAEREGNSIEAFRLMDELNRAMRTRKQ